MSDKEVDLFDFMHTMDVFHGHSMQRWNSAYGDKLGVTPIIVLSKLKKYGPLRGVDLAHKLELTPGAITNITNKLYEKKLISRTTDPQSRRSINYAIEPEGIKILSEAKEIGKKLHMEVIEVLSIEEQEQMLSIYKKINDYFTEKSILRIK